MQVEHLWDVWGQFARELSVTTVIKTLNKELSFGFMFIHVNPSKSCTDHSYSSTDDI